MIELCLSASHQSKNYLKQLGTKKVKFLEILNFRNRKKQTEENKSLKKLLSSKKFGVHLVHIIQRKLFVLRFIMNLRKNIKIYLQLLFQDM